MKKILASFKTAIILISLFAVGMIPGTYITPAVTRHFYATVNSPILKWLYGFFQLSDSYRSWWFITIIILLMINIIACSIYRFPALYKLLTKPSLKIPKKFGKTYAKLLVNQSGIDRFYRRIKKRRYKIIESKDGESRSVLIQFGRWRHFSVFFIHLSLIMIAILGATTSVVGFKGFMTLHDGQSSNTWFSENGKQSGVLPFTIKSKHFVLTYYKTGQLKAFILTGKVLYGSKTKRFKIKVNHPFVYQGVWLYLTSYNIDKKRSKFIIRIAVNGNAKTKELGIGDALATSGISIKAINYTNRFPRAGNALLVEVKIGNFDKSGWIFPGQPVSIANGSVELTKVLPRYYSIIQVSRTPYGMFMMIALYSAIFFTMISFFLPYRRHQLFIVPAKDRKFYLYKRRKSMRN